MSAHFATNGVSRRHTPKGRSWLRVVVTILGVLLVAIVVVGVLLLFSARGVLAKVDTMRAQARQVEQSLLEGDADQLRANSAELSNTISQIHDDVHSPVWTAGSFIPFVGQDVSNARTLVDCAQDLSQNALGPLVDGVAGMRMHDLVVEHAVNTQMLASVRGTVVAVSPVLVANAKTIADLKPGVIGPLNEVLDETRGPLSAAGDLLDDADRLFGMVLSMLGEGGQTRTYVLLAQSNAEIRAGGGFPGSVGIVQVTDGLATLGDFHSVYEVKERISANGYGAPLTDDELTVFGDVLGSDAAGTTLTPNFMRSGEITKAQWENAYGFTVDGVVAMDPVFLQRVLGLIGGVTSSIDGTEVNGENAAAQLMSDVYWRYGYDEDGGALEDAFFTDVAHQSFGKLLDAMGGFELDMFSRLWETIKQSGADRRYQVWMADPAQEAFMQENGLSGNFQTDQANPQLGVYANDNTWSKICWYLDISADLGTPRQNADGTTSYEVTAHFRNNLSDGDAAAAPDYVTGTNPLKRQTGDMVETILIMAPIGGTISNYKVNQDAPLAAESTIPDTHAMLYGRDTYSSRINILPGGDTTATFTLTMPAGVASEPTVLTSPLCHD